MFPRIVPGDRRRHRAAAALVVAALATASWISPTGARAADDLRSGEDSAALAIVGARVVAGRGVAYDPGTVVVRGGLIEAVGPADRVEVPYDAERITGKGLVVYPGFLDLYTLLGSAPGTTRSATGAGQRPEVIEDALSRTPADNRNGLTPEFQVASRLNFTSSVAESRRKLGFTDILAAPGGAIATGQSALVSLAGQPRRESIVRSPVGLHVNLQPPLVPGDPRTSGDPSTVTFRRTEGYPNSLMGAVAHLRQAMLDAEYHQRRRAYDEAYGGPRPVFDPALEALAEARAGRLPVWWEAETRDQIHRALDLTEEFGTKAVIVGGREAAEVADRLKALDVPVVLRLNFPERPEVPTETAYRALEARKRPEPLRVLADRARAWDERVATAAALARAGVRFAFATDGLEKLDLFPAQLRAVIGAGLTAEAAVDALTHQAAEIVGLEARLGTIEPGKLGHLVALSAPIDDAAARVRYVLIDGLKFDLDGAAGETEGEARGTKNAGAASDAPDAEAPATADTPAEVGRAVPPRRAEPMKQQARPEPEVPFTHVASELDEDRRPTIQTGGSVLIKDAVLLTVSELGTIPRGSILVRDGQIEALGRDVGAPPDVAVIDAAGMVAMPGIIDSHSHMAISGGVNESSLSIVPEVRVADVVDGTHPTIYQALAGGVTAARLLHGSANAIGGQDVVIKLRWDVPGRDLILRDDRRPQGVKFALGENVTRNRERFPNTRMGVEAVLEGAFAEGRAYADRLAAHEAAQRRGENPLPFRRDLRLEALSALADGSFRIHGHCYRADEILMLLRLAEREGLHIQSLHHVLEGYKVAAEIAAHGASASTFSDWWAYKVEALDAIPYNAALLSEAGAQVCIKSDNNELIRHLYLEAAKAVRYGGVSEAEALAMITLNPARELGLDHRLGSLEVGKDADIALFNAHPFDGYARCELTLVNGEVAFQRDRDGALTPRPGDHARMPQPSPEAFERIVDIPTNPAGVYALTGATLHPISGPDIADGVLVVAEGRIAALGGPDTPIPPDAETIDLRGLEVWPGMIDSLSQVGLFEVGSLNETRDYADSPRFSPELRTSVALRADSEVIPVTRANGVLSAFVLPTGGRISGRGCLIDLAGWIAPEMVLDDLTALSVGIPEYVPQDPERRRSSDADRRRWEQIDEIRQMFRRATDHAQICDEARQRGDAPPRPDPRLDALIPYARGEKPVVFRANRSVEILDALELADSLNLKAIIAGGADAWKVAGALRAADVPVLLSGTLRLPLEPTDPYDAPYANPARLHAEGVRFAIRSTGQLDPVTNARNLPFEAAVAVAYGLPEEAALRAVTLSPAEILGVADELGSLDVGKRANLVITAGELLQVTSAVKALFIGGRPVAPESRHTRLYEAYRRRLAEVRSGIAPLGLDRHPGTMAGSELPSEPKNAGGSGDRTPPEPPASPGRE